MNQLEQQIARLVIQYDHLAGGAVIHDTRYPQDYVRLTLDDGQLEIYICLRAASDDDEGYDRLDAADRSAVLAGTHGNVVLGAQELRIRNGTDFCGGATEVRVTLSPIDHARVKALLAA